MADKYDAGMTLPSGLRKSPPEASTVPPSNVEDFPNRILQRVDGGLDHALPPVPAIAVARRGLAAHGREGIVARREAHKQREWDQPDAEAKIGGDLGKGGHVGRVVVGRAGDGGLLGALEVAEPEVVVDEDEDCACQSRPGQGKSRGNSPQEAKKSGSLSFT